MQCCARRSSSNGIGGSCLRIGVFNPTSGSIPMTEAPISPLRRRMIEDMTIRKFAPRTQEGYIRAVKGFSAFFGASPDRASFEDLRRYQLHLVASGAGSPTINHSVTALRFLFIVTLRKPQVVIRLPFIREPRKLPIVLSPEEVARLLDAAPSLKHKAALSVAYGAGLRLRDHLAQSRGHRQHPDGYPGRTGQGPQGPIREPVT